MQGFRSVGLVALAWVLMGAGKPRPPEVVLRDARLAGHNYSGDDRGLLSSYAELEQLVATDPKNALAWYLMGNILVMHACGGSGRCDGKQLEAAMEKQDRALALDPNLPEAHVGRGWVFNARKDYWGADAAAKKALALRPGFGSALNLLGNSALEERRYDDVIAAATQMVASGQESNVQAKGHSLLSQTYAALGQDDRADASYRALIALEPKKAWSKGNYAAFLVRKRRFDEAILQAKAALALMNYGAARTTLKSAYQGKAEDLRERLDEKGARKYERLAEAVE